MSGAFTPVIPGSADAGLPAPATPKNVPVSGGPPNPSAVALGERFGAAVRRVDVVCGETTVYVDGARLLDVVQWLHDDPGERYDYLSDVTAVEYRDPERLLQVVWHLRSLP
ncbi:MAG: NADH-quinone oxidoreductase subunit C, partial [Gemmatimonadaceae bacterium]